MLLENAQVHSQCLVWLRCNTPSRVPPSSQASLSWVVELVSPHRPCVRQYFSPTGFTSLRATLRLSTGCTGSLSLLCPPSDGVCKCGVEWAFLSGCSPFGTLKPCGRPPNSNNLPDIPFTTWPHPGACWSTAISQPPEVLLSYFHLQYAVWLPTCPSADCFSWMAAFDWLLASQLYQSLLE